MLPTIYRGILARRIAVLPPLLAALLLLTGTAAGAGPGPIVTRPRGNPHKANHPKVYMDVQPPPEIYPPSGVYFYGKERLEVPGAVVVNAPPYVCDLDGTTFNDKSSFVAHIRTNHGDLLGKAAVPFVVHDGQVRFLGR